MKKINEVIVVEGTSDTRRLKSFFDCETIETHGLGLNKSTIELIRTINEKRGVILMLDPDSPGERIRSKINEAIPGLKNVFLVKEEARTSKKVGIEHASKEVLEKALENVVSYSDITDCLSIDEFYDLGLSGKEDSLTRRNIVGKHFHLGMCNSKVLFKRLNMLNVTYDDIKKVLDD